MTKRFLIALLCLVPLVAGPATTSAGATTDGKARLSAQLLDKKVKVDAKARIMGELDMDTRDGRSQQPIVVQKFAGGVWVDVLNTSCRPNYTFRLNVSFSVAADYQLRVYYPTAAVASATLLLTVF